MEELGRLESLDNGRLRISATQVLDDVAIGESIAVNGCCLTVVAFGDDWWEADVSDETISRTSLAMVHPGDGINLERAVTVSDRLGGHIVEGHVDAVGEVVEPVPDLRVRVPAALTRYLVEKGSVTVDGVSLTVVDALDDGFTVAIIPHTAGVMITNAILTVDTEEQAMVRAEAGDGNKGAQAALAALETIAVIPSIR